MGYESRVYIVEKTDVIDVGMRYARMICAFDLGKCYPLSDTLRNKPKTDCYIYEYDGNTRVLEDCYGQALTESDLQTVIDILEKMTEDNTYRYTLPLLEALKAFEKQRQQGLWRNIAVLHYGY